MLKKILIANRGEIACRVISTAARLGIETVAVFSEADSDALHVELADEVVLLGAAAAPELPARTRSSPPAADRRRRGAPGLRLPVRALSFARARRGGASSSSARRRRIDAMGDKITVEEARRQGRRPHGPGHNGRSRAPSARSRSRRDRLPGDDQGVGRRRRQGAAHRLRTTSRSARKASRRPNEAKSRFGDDRVFIEKFVEQPRHIEIQVLGDAHGNVVYLWERECSIQRRHQKVIEEAPSPVPRRRDAPGDGRAGGRAGARP